MASGVAKSTTRLEQRLKKEQIGETLFDRFSRGRYATDASFYQMMPLGVVVPRTMEQAKLAVEIARSEGVSVVARGGGTSQCGQTINEALVIDCSKYLNRILSLDVEGRRCVVEPGIVMDELNRQLKPHGLWFAVDISTSSRATIGGMTANNSCGGRSLRYGPTRENVLSIEAMLADGSTAKFGPEAADLSTVPHTSRVKNLYADLTGIARREESNIRERFPDLQRRVGGYNLDALLPDADGRINMAHILVGSEGTLAFSSAIELKLWPLLGRRAVGACHFGSFYEAMNAVQHIVKLKPIAVELVDATMIELARDIAMFRPTLEQFVRGEPEAVLLVEFAEDDAENAARIRQLHELMGDLGFGWDRDRRKWGGVVEVMAPALQTSVAELRSAGLNIMMSMKEARKPVSFIEDCAVPLPHLAEYTRRLTEVFQKHGTTGTWYAHASVGCLHVRPVLNLKQEKDVTAMRAIAEEAFAFVREYKGSHSGEHGDGMTRSEFHEPMFGERLVRTFEEVKDRFDPNGMFNPGKIVRAPKFDDRSKFRYSPSYAVEPRKPVLDWSDYPDAVAGLDGAVEMCNNNGACRKLTGGSMCPSYRVTRDERDVTRGRANTLRLALTGQLGKDALTSNEMAETMKLCVSCKACRSECPTGVDMARMKIEVLAARAKAKGIKLRDRLIAYMPHYAHIAARLNWFMNLRDRLPGLPKLSEWILGFAARRPLPKWSGRVFRSSASVGPANGLEVVLFADTHNRYFDAKIVDAALSVLTSAGYRVHLPQAADGTSRHICCGRTFLSAGLVEKAKAEAARALDALAPFAERGVPIVGLEPSCLYTFRDEIPAYGLGDHAKAVAREAVMFEEFIAREAQAGRLHLKLEPLDKKVLVHGHCHEKSFGAMGALNASLRLIPGLAPEIIDSACCGMAGAFGYQAESYDTSMAMGELSLLPAVRQADANTVIVADGTSCRCQIRDGAARETLHLAEVLAMCLKEVKKKTV